ncbi:MAG: sugar transferase, partial [Microlunatus sp.]|nr:sugar transferase [Microlunatus sp.]
MSGSDTAVGLLGQTTAADAEEHTDGIQRIASKNTIHVGDTIRRRTRGIVNDTRDFRGWSSSYLRWMCGLDAVAGLVAVVVAALRQQALHPAMINQWPVLGVIGLVAWPVSVGAARGYRRHQVSVGATELRAVLQAGGVIIVIAALLTAWFGVAGLLGSVGIAAPVAAAASVGVRVACCRRLRRRQRYGQNLRRVIMVGSTEAVQELRTVIEREPSMGMRVAGVCVPAAQMRRARELGMPVVGDVDHVAAIASELACDAVAVTGTDAMRSGFLRQLAWSLEDTDAELLLHPGLVDVALPRMHLQSYTHAPMLHVEQPRFEGWTRRIKRGMDLMITGFGLLLISPLLAAVALVIKLDDGGPIIFRQIRIGTDGKPFLMLKFRSMCVDAE